jgi:hypothetical protein
MGVNTSPGALNSQIQSYEARRLLQPEKDPASGQRVSRAGCPHLDFEMWDKDAEEKLLTAIKPADLSLAT